MIYIWFLRFIIYLNSGKDIIYIPPIWGHLKLTVDKFYYQLDYIPLVLQFLTWILTFLAPRTDNTERKSLNHWKSLDGTTITKSDSSDSSLNQLLWNQTMSFFMRPHKKGYVIDFSYLEKYEVKSEYYRYGGKCYLVNGKITKMKYLSKTYHTIPLWLEKVFRSTIFVVLQLETHAIRLHLLTAQNNVIKYRTLTTSRLIPLLKVLTFNTIEDNRGVGVIIELVKTITAFTDSSFSQYCDDSFQKGQYDMEEIMGSPGTAWNKEMSQYRQHVDTFLFEMNLINKSQIDTNIDINFIRTFFLVVTACHDQFGDANEANIGVKFEYPPRIKINDEETMSILEYEIIKTLVSLVFYPTPLLSEKEWTHNADLKKHKLTINKFVKNISIDTKTWFNPSQFKISVAN